MDNSKKIKIYGYWHNKELPEFLKNSINKTLTNNPYLEYDIFDDELAKDFLKLNFPKEVLDAYNILKPYSFKSDLFRFCLLYINGGIYIDLKLILKPVDKSFFLNNNYHFAKNRRRIGYSWKIMQNTFLYFKYPKNPRLKKTIDRIITNVKNRDKTCHNLYLTGPILLGEFFQDIPSTLKFKGQFKPIRKFVLSYNGNNIIDTDLTDYYYGKRNHQQYWTMWRKNDVFN